jgi:hypothetical protein
MSGQLEDWQRQALQTEYKVCEQDNSGNFQGFWTLAAIFLGLSSAFFAGFIYAVIANKSLFNILLYQNEPRQTLTIGIIALIIGTANVVILRKLKGWHRRIMYNQGLNLSRMREIELDLDLAIYRGWRILAIDTWANILASDKRKKCDDQKWDKLKEKLKDGLDDEHIKKLDKREKEILGLLKQYFTEEGEAKRRHGKYELSSSSKHFPCILYTLMSLWVLLVIAAALLIIGISFWSIVGGIIVAIGVLITFAVLVHREQEHHLDQ